MCLVDRDTCKLSLLVDDAKVLPKIVKLAVLWRDVKEARMRMATLEVVEDGGFGRVRSGAVDCGDVDAGGA